MTAEYEWDLFISYRRQKPIVTWLQDHFLELLEFKLEQELGRAPSIFFDQLILKGGENWPEAISSAVTRSRCLLAIWTGTYFASDWCRAEWDCFAQRTLDGTANGRLPAVPILWHDGKHIPEDVLVVQYTNFKPFAYTGPAFRESSRFLEFEDQVATLAEVIGEAVENAPPCGSAWCFTPPGDAGPLDSESAHVPKPRL